MRRTWKASLALVVPLALVVLVLLMQSDTSAQSPGRSASWTCSLTATAGTLLQCQGAPPPGERLYLTDIVITSDTATAGQFLLRTGTGANCGTGTASLLPSSVTAVALGYPGNASAPAVLSFITPLTLPRASALCILCVATNTCTTQLSGYVAP